MWNSPGFSSRMTSLSPQPKPNILHTAAARAVNLKVKSDPGTPYLNPSGGLRTSCISLKFAPGARGELNLQKEIKWPYQWGKEVMQWQGMWLSQINHRLWGDLKENGWPSSTLSFLIVKRMDRGLTSLNRSSLPYVSCHHSLSRKMKPLSFTVKSPETQVARGPLSLHGACFSL